MEQIENHSDTILIGEVDSPSTRQHIFHNLDALVDFVVVFKIENFNCRSGIVNGGNLHGKKIFELTYESYHE